MVYLFPFLSEITILLSLTVFMTVVADKLPQVSDAIPLLGRVFHLSSESSILFFFSNCEGVTDAGPYYQQYRILSLQSTLFLLRSLQLFSPTPVPHI